MNLSLNKLCSKCDQPKPELTGRRRVCDACKKKHHHQYYLDNQAKLSKYGDRSARANAIRGHAIRNVEEDVSLTSAEGRTCCDCKLWKEKEEYWAYTPTGNLFAYCKSCGKDRLKRSHKKRYADPECRENMLVSQKNRKRKVKQEVIDGYGGKCVCCGENQLEFLTLDHVDGNGAEHRRLTGLKTGHSTWAYARREGFPDMFRLLCWNCNSARGAFGYCPHEMPE